MYVLKNPDYKWRCEVMKDVFYYVEEGKQPNALNRFMGRMLLGVKWTKLD